MKKHISGMARARWRMSFFILAPLLTMACSRAQAVSERPSFALQASQSLGCESFVDDFWDAIYQYPLTNKNFPSAADAEALFEKSFDQERLKNVSRADRIRLSQALRDLYSVIAFDAIQELAINSHSSSQVLEALTSLELGDRSSPQKEKLQDRIQDDIATINRLVKSIPMGSCKSMTQPEDIFHEETAGPGALLSHWKATQNPVVYGGLKTLAIAYQSCEAGALNPLSATSPDVQGIKIVGQHSDGIGNKRIISDLPALLKTDYYLSNYRKPAASCFEIRKNPLIYDYGGKPDTLSSGGTTLNLFKNAGTGTAALGVDCSGYVYTALASAGMKLKTSGRLKAIDVQGFSAHLFMNPQKNGLNCFDKVTFKGKSSLAPGDIFASQGHVVIVASVGQDPFGIAGIRDISDCTTDNISVSRFNFTILQSSPTKNGIGIDRIRASDYLGEEDDMKDGIISYAVGACRAALKNSSTTVASGKASLIRHSTSSSCQDQEVALDHQDCVSSCPATRAQIL